MIAKLLLVVCGIFVVGALTVVTAVLRRNQLGVGYWPLLTGVAAALTLGEILSTYGSSTWRTFGITVAMILLFFIALIKYWDTLRLIE